MTAAHILTRGKGISLWRQIAQQLERDIQAKVLQPGDQLPTEWELTQRFRVNRHTVRRALAALAECGVVRAEQGRGTFVQESVLDYPITRKTRFSETIRAQAREPMGEIVRLMEDKACGPLGLGLRLDPGAMVNLMDVLRYADGRPVSITTHIYEKTRFPHMPDHYRIFGSMTGALAAAGVADFSRLQTKVNARLPSQEEVRLLQTVKTRPMLVTESVDVDADGAPLVLSVTRFPADRVQLIFEP